MFKLNEESIINNYDKLLKIIEEDFPTRKTEILAMYDDLGERVMLCPASTNPNYHNAFPGGYVEHILRVYNFAKFNYVNWKNMGMDVSGFTKEELLFTAIHHDLGKVGFKGENNDYYLPNDNQWEIEKRNKLYSTNSNITWMSLADMSLELLQEYGVKLSLNEWHAIRVHDGPYEETNKTYYMNFFNNGKFKTNLPYILHYSDLMAMRFEYQRYLDSKK